MDIGERPIPCFPDIAILGPTRLPNKIRSIKDRLDLAWGLWFGPVILRSHPPVIDIILEVPATDELLYLVFERDALLSGMNDIFMELVVLIMIPFGAMSM